MTGSLGSLALATALFVVSHFVLSAGVVRGALVGRLGEWPFRGLYSLVALGLLVWVILAYNAAPAVVVWSPPIGLKHLSLTLMPIACILIVAGVTTPGPASVAGRPEVLASRGAVGVQKITRHPVMMGIALWAKLHLLANGDAAGMILFGGMFLLALIGAWHIDVRRAAALGEAWRPFAAATSYWPFLAALDGRTHLRWRDIGRRNLFFGLALYALLLRLHPDLFGVNPLPF